MCRTVIRTPLMIDYRRGVSFQFGQFEAPPLDKERAKRHAQTTAQTSQTNCNNLHYSPRAFVHRKLVNELSLSLSLPPVVLSQHGGARAVSVFKEMKSRDRNEL